MKELERDYSYQEYQEGVALLKVQDEIEDKLRKKAEAEAESHRR